MTRHLRTITSYALAAYTVFVLALTLWPEPVDKPVARQIRTVIDRAHEAGAPPKLGYNLIEYSANVFLFVPLGILLAMLLAPRLWWIAPVLGISLTLAIEFTQSQMPDRHASQMDLLYNTIGALAGALLVVAIRWMLDRRSRRNPASVPHTA